MTSAGNRHTVRGVGWSDSVPEGFIWGAATSAYQIEGAVHEDGRGRVDLGHLCPHAGPRRERRDRRHRGRPLPPLSRGHRAHVATSGSRRTASRSPGRASSRAARGPANERGLDFYRRLVDALLEAGIEPYPTLFHWDLPQELQDAGGWPERDTAYRFAEYAGIVLDALGDRVNHWLTLNEPWCAAFLGYGLGRHAPGHHDGREAVVAAHHLMLGHGLAVEQLRAKSAPGVEFSIVLNLEPHRPASESRADVAAARLVDGMHNRIFLDPILRGALPRGRARRTWSRSSASAHIQDGDLETISAPLDLLGVNYYRPGITAARTEPAPGFTLWPGDEWIEAIPQEGEKTTMGWVVDPGGARGAAAPARLRLRRASAADHRERRLLRRPRRARRERSRPGPGRVPRRPSPRGPPRARGRGRPARLLRLVAARQLRVGGGVQQALRRRLHRLRDSPSDSEGERPLVRPRDLGGWRSETEEPDGEVGAGRARVAPDPGGGRRPRGRLQGDGLARHQQLAEGER